MLLTLLPDEIGVSVSYPLPGTEFHQQVQAQMGGKTNWEHSDDLALMYRGTFSPAYYRRLHRYVHKRFQAARVGPAWWRCCGGRGRPTEVVEVGSPDRVFRPRECHRPPAPAAPGIGGVTSFDAVAESYDGSFTDSRIGRAQRRSCGRHLEGRVLGPAPMAILELGCGTGEDAVRFAAQGHRVHAVDSSAAMLGVGGAKARAAGVAQQIHFEQVDLRQPDRLGAGSPAVDLVFRTSDAQLPGT